MKSGKMMFKNQNHENHHKAWSYIVEQLEAGVTQSVDDIKAEAQIALCLPRASANCYACEEGLDRRRAAGMPMEGKTGLPVAACKFCPIDFGAYSCITVGAGFSLLWTGEATQEESIDIAIAIRDAEWRD